MNEYGIFKRDIKFADLSENPKIVDTAGFEPLETKIKRFLLSGMVAQVRKDMFDSSDYKEMLETVPLALDYDDELEEAYDKLKQVSKIRADIIARKKSELASKTSNDKNVSEKSDEVKTKSSDEITVNK